VKTRSVHLGFEVGTGEPVSIAIRHMAVTGQTQEAGKTTTLQALIERSGLRAVTFITKRGESSFQKARRIAPYFREQTDWQFVASILEASRGEKLKFERAWIIRASRGARTLADVQRNVRAAMEKARGLSADVYLTLDAYLDQVVPQIATVKWAPTLDLQPGVNAVDLGDLSVEMQHLVIRSAITWVLEKEKGTVVVVPEAWKFIPQGRGTPVKLAAEAFVRQGAALGNYLWLDSQDLGGIDKAILRSVAVWLLGVQRESNEIKRTLDNIPAIPSKPRPGEIATLRLGEFFACWGSERVRTYVQPAWMSETAARAVARGGAAGSQPKPVDPLMSFVNRGRAAQGAADREIARATKKEEPEMCEQHQQLERQVAALRTDLKAQSDRALRAEERARVAEETSGAAADFGRALARLLPAGAGSVEAVDLVRLSDAVVERVLARIPAGGAGPITVTPPEKLRKDFQREESERILDEVRGFDALGKRVLKLLEGLEGGILTQKGIAERLGRATGGGSWVSLGTAVRALTDAGFLEIDPKRGVRAATRTKISADLSTYRATEGEVEAVYQAVLHAIATEGEAAA
jgi:hypothetical protein